MKLFGANLTSPMGGNWTGAALSMAKKVNPMGAVDQLLQTVTSLLDALLSNVQSLLSVLQLIVPLIFGVFALFSALFLLLFCMLLFLFFRVAFPRQSLRQIGQNERQMEAEKGADQNALEEQKPFVGNEKEKK